jgi:hypothetical protein
LPKDSVLTSYLGSNPAAIIGVLPKDGALSGYLGSQSSTIIYVLLKLSLLRTQPRRSCTQAFTVNLKRGEDVLQSPNYRDLK